MARKNESCLQWMVAKITRIAQPCTHALHTPTPTHYSHACTLYAHMSTLDTHTCIPTHAYPHMHITHSSISENELLLLEKGRICAGQGYGKEFWDCPGCFGTFHNYHTHMAIVLLHCKAILGCFNLIPC